jgi:putative membrane protein
MMFAVWVRESVNGLLPVARIGGEIASYRMLRRAEVRGALAAASLVVDMAFSILSQLTFAMVGVGLLVAAGGHSNLVWQIALGLLTMVALCVAFIVVQRSGGFEALTRTLSRIAAGRLALALERSVRIDRAVRMIYRRRRALAACFLWQLAGWLTGACEIWLALYFLRHSVDFGTALAIEALIQAVSSAAFVVPSALGVQEAAFLVLGTTVGLDATTALALASARRVRDIVIFFPGLLAWQWGEYQGGSMKSAQESR